MSIRIEILGPFRLLVDGSEVAIKRNQVIRTAVALAAVTPDSLSQDQLVEHLWGDRLPSDPRASLRVALSRLRNHLGDSSDLLTSQAGTYSLVATTDMGEYEDLLRQAAGADTDREVDDLLSDASIRWSDSLENFQESRVLQPIEGRLRTAHQGAVTKHIECIARLGDHQRVLDLATPRHTGDAGDESAAMACARALSALGRRSAALGVLDQTRTHLRDELGLNPSRRFVQLENTIVRDTAELVPSAPAPAPAAARRFFVGRERELAVLTDPSPGFYVIVGEPGVGKTELVSVATEQLAGTGRKILTTRATQSATRPMEALAGLLVAIAESSEAPHTDGLRSALSRLAPNLVSGPVTTPGSRDGLLTLAREAIEEYAASHDAIIVIDDAHWLDRSSALVFEALIQSNQATVFVTTRERLPAHADFLHDVSRIELLALSPLASAEIETFVEAELPFLPSSPTTAQVLAQSGGNALFMTLLVDLLREGSLTKNALPPSVLTSVQRRFESLPQQAQRTLQVAAAFAGPFPLEVLGAIRPNAVDEITVAIDEGLVVKTDDPDRYRFAHALVAESAYQLLAEGDRVDLHDEIGRSLENWGAAAAEYAHHCSQAVALDPNRAVQAHAFAAHEFASSFDWDTAQLHAQQGLEHLEQNPGGPPAFHADLLVSAGASLRAQGRLDGDPLLIQGVALALDQKHLPITVTGLLALCTHGRMETDDGPEIHRLLRLALQQGLSVSQRAQLLACESTLVAISPLQEIGRQSHRRAFAMLDRFDDLVATREVLLRTHLGFPHPEDFALRSDATERLHTIATNDPDLMWEVAFLSFGTAMVLNQADEAAAYLDEMRDLTPRIRMRQHDFGLRFSEAAWSRFNNELDQAEAQLAEALELGQESLGDGWTMVIHSALLSSIREAQGRLHELVPFVDAQLRTEPDRHQWHVIAAAGAASVKDRERTERELAWLKQDNFRCLLPDMSWSAMFSFLTEPVAFVQDKEAAAELLRLIEPYAGLNLWNGACVHKSADHAISVYRQVAEAT